MRRGVLAAALLAVAVALPAHAVRGQVLGRAANVCTDGSHGVSLVAQSPVAPTDGSVSMVLIYHRGVFGDAYEQELQYAAAPPKTDTLQAARDAQAHATRLMAAMNQVFAHARFAQPDGHGVILCGDLEPGTYDVLAMAQIADLSSSSAGITVRYFLAHAAIPKAAQRTLVRATPFVRL